MAVAAATVATLACAPRVPSERDPGLLAQPTRDAGVGMPAANSADGGPLFEVLGEWAGRPVIVRPEGFADAKLFRTEDGWWEADVVSRLRPNTPVTIVEVRRYRWRALHFRVKTGTGEEGWLSLSDLECNSAMCDDNHPQRTWPFQPVHLGTPNTLNTVKEP